MNSTLVVPVTDEVSWFKESGYKEESLCRKLPLVEHHELGGSVQLWKISTIVTQFFTFLCAFVLLFSPLFRDLHVACIMYSFHRVSISLTIDKIQHKKEKPTQWSVLVHRYFGTLHDTIMTTNVESVANLWEYAMCVFETAHVSPREFEWIFWIFEDRSKVRKKERKKKRGERSIAAANIQKRWARIKMDDISL